MKVMDKEMMFTEKQLSDIFATRVSNIYFRAYDNVIAKHKFDGFRYILVDTELYTPDDFMDSKMCNIPEDAVVGRSNPFDLQTLGTSLRFPEVRIEITGIASESRLVCHRDDVLFCRYDVEFKCSYVGETITIGEHGFQLAKTSSWMYS